MELARVIEKAVSGLGYELVDLEAGSRSGLLRVFIDAQPRGVTVEDCERVSDHLTRLLEVENIDYGRLEVSSPGLDRVLRTPADFERFAGAEVHVRLRAPIEGRRNYTGVLKGSAGGRLLIDCGGAPLGIDLEQVAKARLVPAYDGIGKRHGGR
ncbi:MAG: ribosome maturation factor RimP [Rhodocyclaceae bacterium]